MVFVVLPHHSYYRYFYPLTTVVMWLGATKNRTFNAEKPPFGAVFLKKGGPSDRIRTCGILLPKQARYQLRYTRLLSYSIRLGVFTQSRRATNCATPRYSIKPHYSIMGRFRKAFLVMVKIVGWLQKRVNFRKTETRKPLCRKALRRFQKMGLTKSYYVPNQARYQLRYTRILLILE